MVPRRRGSAAETDILTAQHPEYRYSPSAAAAAVGSVRPVIMLDCQKPAIWAFRPPEMPRDPVDRRSARAPTFLHKRR